MDLRWTDIHDIAIELEDRYPEVNILQVRFTDLHKWVIELPNFSSHPTDSSEKILEAIQMAWLQERE